MSPTIHETGPYRFFFWSNEPNRPHTHCQHDNKSAKYWLEKLGKPQIEFVANESSGFASNELHTIEKIVEDNLYFFLKVWYDKFQQGKYPTVLAKWLQDHPTALAQ